MNCSDPCCSCALHFWRWCTKQKSSSSVRLPILKTAVLHLHGSVGSFKAGAALAQACCCPGQGKAAVAVHLNTGAFSLSCDFPFHLQLRVPRSHRSSSIVSRPPSPYQADLGQYSAPSWFTDSPVQKATHKAPDLIYKLEGCDFYVEI